MFPKCLLVSVSLFAFLFWPELSTSRLYFSGQPASTTTALCQAAYSTLSGLRVIPLMQWHLREAGQVLISWNNKPRPRVLLACALLSPVSECRLWKMNPGLSGCKTCSLCDLKGRYKNQRYWIWNPGLSHVIYLLASSSPSVKWVSY